MTKALSPNLPLNDCETLDAYQARGHGFTNGCLQKNNTHRFGGLPMWGAALLLATVLAGCGSVGSESGAQSNATAAGLGGGVGGKGHGPAPLDLGMANNFSILSVFALTNLPSSAVT